MKQARRQAAERERRIIWNNDCDDIGWFDTPEQFLAGRFQQVADTQVDTIFDCTGVTTLFTHQTHVAEMFGQFLPPGVTSPRVVKWSDNIRALGEAGYDTLELGLKFCRENDIEYLWTLRMNDIHDSWMDEEFSRWKREHPEYMFGERPDYDEYPSADFRKWWSALDFEIPEVRDYIFRILEEVCQRYDVDGIELDWMRHPKFFRSTTDGNPATPAQVEMMNDLVRRIRTMTERVAEQRGRPLLVATRVTLSVEHSLGLGLDLESWLEEDLVDIVTVGGGYACLSMAPQVREMAQFIHSYDVPVYACISGSEMVGTHGSVEAWRAAAMNVWEAGADGIYTFNLFPRTRDERFSQMGSPETLRGLNKLYGVDYMDVPNYASYQQAGIFAPDRLPVALVAGGTVTVKLPVGEDIVANAPTGKTTDARLRLRVSKIASGDEINVWLNGEVLGAASPVEALSPEPADAWLELQLEDGLVRVGTNLVQIKLSSQRSGQQQSVLSALDLVVQYQ